MLNLKGIKPYSDDKLVWNAVRERYELAFEYCKEEYEDNFNDDKILKDRIKKNSRIVYNFIYSRVNQYNLPVVNSLISKTEQGRNFIFELLSSQFESDVDSGYNDLTNVSPVNVSNGNILPREEIKRNEVSVQTETIWDNSASYFGINIGYQSHFPSYYFLLVRGL